MEYNLYIHKKGAEGLEWSGGKVYGYKGSRYKGAAYLYFLNKPLRDRADFFYPDIKNVENKMRHFFEDIPRC